MKDIAIIGISCHFPGAKNKEQFWDNLRNGVDSIRKFTKQELLDAGEDIELLNDPNYVFAAPVIEDYDKFDAGFFGYSPNVAAMTNPEARLMVQCAWQTLEDAGYVSEKYKGLIGIYAGALMHNYYKDNICSTIEFEKWSEAIRAFSLNEKEYLTTMIADRLHLKGPAITLQSFCSTSLMVIHYACQDLLSGMCDIALAGGINVRIPQERGHVYEEGGMVGPYDHSKVFDEKASGTIFGSGYGLVALKLLDKAIEDNDHIYAVIKGTSVNNDGGNKLSFMGPSISGQSNVMKKCLEISQIDPKTIGYVEAHGTGTDVGDRIEFLAISKALKELKKNKNKCPIGSVKTNIGHLGIASGIAGFIKTVLTLHNKAIPPSLHFDKPNPHVRYEENPFYVNTEYKPWDENVSPRRAVVNSQGVGGTNTCVILEEAPELKAQSSDNGYYIFPFSAKSKKALNELNSSFISYFKENSHQIANVSHTLCHGRKHFEYRNFVVANNREEVIENLNLLNDDDILVNNDENQDSSVVFMFPGQGSQYINMGAGLYEDNAVFRKYFDKCAEIIKSLLNEDIRDIILNENKDNKEAAEKLKLTKYAQPCIFSLEYSLAKLWTEIGIQPAAMIGHSVGEFVAACIAGTVSLEDALLLIVKRGELMYKAKEGGMLSVPLGHKAIIPLLNENVSMGAINSPFLTIVSGPYDELEKLKQEIEKKGKECSYLHTSHAFHSVMMEPIVQEFRDIFNNITLSKPTIPIMSTVTGDWLKDSEAVDPNHWANNLRNTVLFSPAIAKLLDETNYILLEVGPGKTLATLTKCHKDQMTDRPVLTSLRHMSEDVPDTKNILLAVGKLWCNGIEINWESLFGEKNCLKVSMPSYPFEKQRHWIDFAPKKAGQNKMAASNIRHFYKANWKENTIYTEAETNKTYLIFADESGISKTVSENLAKNNTVITVYQGNKFVERSKNTYEIDIEKSGALAELLDSLKANSQKPDKVIYIWNTKKEDNRSENTLNNSIKKPYTDFFYLLEIAKTLGKSSDDNDIWFYVVTKDGEAVNGKENIDQLNSLTEGIVKVAPQEYNGLYCQHIDISSKEEDTAITAAQIINETNIKPDAKTVAYRDIKRWERFFEPIGFNSHEKKKVYNNSDVYIITGGLGGLGFEIARHISEMSKASIILTGRTDINANDNADNKSVSSKIDKLNALKKLNENVTYFSLDITDYEKVQKFASLIKDKYNAINGIFHCAGNAGKGIIELKSKENAVKVLSPKVLGTIYIYEFFKDSIHDFLLLYSSIASVKSIAGQVDYTAANAFLDSFTRTSNDKRIKSVNWDLWGETGMGLTAVPDSIKNERQQDLANGIKTDEGIAIIDSFLASTLYKNIIVSNKSIDESGDFYLMNKETEKTNAKTNEDIQELVKIPDIKEWFYSQTWIRSQFPIDKEDTESETWLVLANNTKIVQKFITFCKSKNQNTIIVRQGDAFQGKENDFVINPESKEDYQKLLRELKANNSKPNHIVHFWTVEEEVPEFNKESFSNSQNKGIFSMIYLLQALDSLSFVDDMKLHIITKNIYNISGYEKLEPRNATVLGLLKVVSLEYPNITIRNIDLDSDPVAESNLYNELTLGEYQKIKAIRNNKCWMQSYNHASLQNTIPKKSVIRDGGVYLITGGLDVVGYRVAGFMAQMFNLKIALIGEMKTHKWDKWNDYGISGDGIAVSEYKLNELKKHNSEIENYGIDLTSADEWNDTVNTIIKKWGKIDGIIHAAATLDPNSFKTINKVTQSEFEEHFKTKIYASLIIKDIIKNYSINQCLFVSSVSSILGGIEFVTYSSVNNFIDNFVNHLKQVFGEKTIAILNLDELQFTEKEQKITRFGKELQKLSISKDELTQVFSYFFSGIVENQIVISTSELLPRLKKWHGLNKKQETSQVKKIDNVPTDNVLTQENIRQNLILVWKETLGFDTVDVNDNFYSLGGDSLLATSMVNKLRKRYGALNISISDILDHPTIEKQVKLIEKTHNITTEESQTTSQNESSKDDKEEIIKIWKETLCIDKIKINDNFYTLGGDDSLAKIMVDKLQMKFGIQGLSVSDIIENPTVEKQEQLVKQLQNKTVKKTRDLLSTYKDSEKSEREKIINRYFVQLLKNAELINDDADLQNSISNNEKITGLIYTNFLKDFDFPVYENEIRTHSNYNELLSYLFNEIEKVNGFAQLETNINFDIPKSGQKIKNRSLFGKRKNPSMVFIHSAPRSGSTIFRLMLEGHQKLFSPPEFQLLGYDNLAQWNKDRVKITRNYSGLAYSLARINNTDLKNANAKLDELVAKSLSVKDTYKHIQNGLKDVMLVDKSPNYALDYNNLVKAEEIFDKPKYIHLVRHPYPVIESFVRNRMYAWFEEYDNIDPYKFGEKIWYINNYNLSGFKEIIPEERYLIVSYENLVLNLNEELNRICSFLGLEFDSGMLDPYEGQKMLEGCGDPTIYKRNAIDKDMAEVWKKIKLPITLSDCTKELMKTYNYIENKEPGNLDIESSLQDEIFRELQNEL